MDATRWPFFTRSGIPLLTILLLSGLIAPGCSLTGSEPEPEHNPARFLDGASSNGALLLTWDSYIHPPPEGPNTPAEQPKRVLVFISEESATSGFHLLADRQGGILDSLTVSELVNGRAYYFYAIVMDKRGLPYFTSDPIVVVPGVDPKALLSIDLGYGGVFRSAAAWSPDSREIAYIHASHPYLRIMDLETQVERSLTGATLGGYVNDPAWSPGGTLIAYTSSDGGINYRISTTNVAGTAQQSLTPGRVDFGPAWGATDTVIVFCRGTYEAPNIPEIYCVDPRSPDSLRGVTRDQRLRKRWPSVRNSDQMIVFQGNTGASFGLYLVPIGGGTIAPLLIERWWEESAPAWSPDGQRIAFTSTRSGHPDIWVLDLSNHSFRQLTTGRFRQIQFRFASWSPDGTRLAIVEQSTGGSWRLDILALP